MSSWNERSTHALRSPKETISTVCSSGDMSMIFSATPTSSLLRHCTMKPSSTTGRPSPSRWWKT